MFKSQPILPVSVILLRILITASVYFFLAQLSLLLQFETSHATPVWPPSGFAFAIMIIWGYRIIPGVLLGAFAANFLNFIQLESTDPSTAILLSFVIAIGNVSESYIGTYLFRQLYPKFSVNAFFEKVSDVFWFSLIALLVCLISSSVGATSIYLSGNINADQYAIVLATWWLGDFAGILLVAPLLLLFLKSTIVTSRVLGSGWDRRFEIVALFTSTILVSGIIFDGWFFPPIIFNWSYWIIPILVWAALRFTQREVITALAINAVILIWGTINHHGPFGLLALNDALLSAQSFISIMVITKLTLNISVLQRRRTEKILRDTGAVLEEHVKNRTAQLEERNRFVETLLDSSGDCIIVIDKDSRILDFNRCAEENYAGPTHTTIRGKRIFDLDSDRMPEFDKSAIHAAFRGETVKREKVKVSGSDKYYENTFIPLNNSDGTYAVMIISRDITHRILAENEILEQKIFAELLIESSPYLILAHDKDLKFTAWNKMSEDHTGIKKEQVLGKHILEVFPEYQDNNWFALTQEVLTDGRTLHFPKIEFQYKPGWGESFVTPLINSRNEIVGLLSITREITDLINITSALEKKNQDLQNMNEELSSFAYVASHDLQEPLRKIQMFAKRIIETEKETLSEKARDYFDRMNNAAKRMQQLIENLLTYSRTKNAERKFEKVSFNDVLNEVKEELKDELLLTKATIVAGDLCTASINAFQFRQLLHNLISNSLKFASEERNPVIRINSQVDKGSQFPYSKLEPEKKYCHLIIADNGIGFDQQYNEQIFGLFQRLYGKSEYPGTGIGLAICKKIVENHNGFITAEGRPGEGATFHIYVPLEV